MLDWGGTSERGFVAVSRTFLRSYRELGLTLEEAMLVIMILEFSWGSSLPYPSVSTLANRTGKTPKTVRRYLRALRSKGFLRTKPRKGRSNAYDFGPLFSRLAELDRTVRLRVVGGGRKGRGSR